MYTHHSAFPSERSSGFSCFNEEVTFFGSEHVIEDDGIESFIFVQIDLSEVDALGNDVRCRFCEEVLRQD